MADKVIVSMRDERALEWVNEELDKLQEKAKEECDRFWFYHYESRVGDAPIGEWSKYGCRVRRGETTVKIEWYLIYYVGPAGQRKIRSKHLARGAGFWYMKRSFSKANAEELEKIMAAEAIFGDIRKLCDALSKMVRSMDGYHMARSAAKARLGYEP